MIGLMAKPVNHFYNCRFNEPGFDDTRYEGTKRMRVLKEFGLEQMVMEYEQVSNACMMPIHLQIMDHTVHRIDTNIKANGEEEKEWTSQ